MSSPDQKWFCSVHETESEALPSGYMMLAVARTAQGRFYLAPEADESKIAELTDYTSDSTYL
jgi:hypothetical protein